MGSQGVAHATQDGNYQPLASLGRCSQKRMPGTLVLILELAACVSGASGLRSKVSMEWGRHPDDEDCRLALAQIKIAFLGLSQELR